jgi:hypothetical protein
VINTTTEPDTLALTAGDTQQETTSIGVEVGWSTGLDILGFANTKISATVTGGHSWSITDTTARQTRSRSPRRNRLGAIGGHHRDHHGQL